MTPTDMEWLEKKVAYEFKIVMCQIMGFHFDMVADGLNTMPLLVAWPYKVDKQGHFITLSQNNLSREYDSP